MGVEGVVLIREPKASDGVLWGYCWMGVSVSGVLGFIRGVFMVGLEGGVRGRPSSYLFIFPFMFFLGKENILVGGLSW